MRDRIDVKNRKDTRGMLQHACGGFTLVEMLVAVALFAVAMTIALSTLLNISNIQNKAEVVRTINDSLNFAIEAMSRELRTGKNYQVLGAGHLSFVPASAAINNVEYRLKNDVIQRCELDTCNDGDFLTLTSPKAVIYNLEFVVKAVAGKEMVTIILNGYSGEKEISRSYFDLQATVSRR